MLLLVGGWPMSVQAFVSGNPALMPTKEIPDGEEIFRPLTNTASYLGYTLYPVDVPGIEGQGDDSSSLAGVAAGPPDRQNEIEASLQFLAKETGGKPLFNSNRTVALATAMEDTRSYYWLGFSPEWKRNDQRHTIKVEVLRPGLKVRSRNGFLDLSKEAEISLRVEAALQLGGAAGPGSLRLRVGDPVRKKGGIEMPLSLGIPVEALTVLPEGDRYTARLELRVVASGEEGATSDVPVIPLSFSWPRPPAPGEILAYETKVTLHGKAERLLAAVYDPVSGRLSSAQAALPARP